jgi:hypothetical protein
MPLPSPQPKFPESDPSPPPSFKRLVLAVAPFFAGFDYAFFAAARFAAHIFFVAAMIAFRPAAESFRLGFGACSPLIFAHLAFCAKAIFRRAAALNFLRLPGVASGVAAGGEPSGSMVRSSAICSSIRRFWDSKPLMAALIISGVSFCVGIEISVEGPVYRLC